MSIGEIRTPGAPDFSPHIERLLKEANIRNTPDARSSLFSSLHLAWGDVQLERMYQKTRIPSILYRSLNNSIKETQRLLRRLEKLQLRGIDTDRCPVVDGTALTQPIVGWFDEVPPGATMVVFNRQRMLDRLLRDIARYNPKRKRGRQQERDKFLIVARASHFFRQYSPEKPTGYPNGRFAKFCKKFYEVITGDSPSGSSLEKLIRNEVKAPTIETQMTQKT